MTVTHARLAARLDALRGPRPAPAPAEYRPPKADPPADPLLLDPGAAAGLLGVSARTLRRWNVPRVRIGGVVGYRRQDLEAFVAAHVVKGA